MRTTDRPRADLSRSSGTDGAFSRTGREGFVVDGPKPGQIVDFRVLGYKEHMRNTLPALALALAACTGAVDIDPAQIRVLTPTTIDLNDPNCMIGRRSTPLCAVEFQIICANHLVDMACSGERMPYNVERRRDKDRVEYVIVKSGFANPDKVRAIPKHLWDSHRDYYEYLLKGVFQAHVLERSCPATRPSCEGVPWEAAIFNVGSGGRPPDIWDSGYAVGYYPSNWFVD